MFRRIGCKRKGEDLNISKSFIEHPAHFIEKRVPLIHLKWISHEPAGGNGHQIRPDVAQKKTVNPVKSAPKEVEAKKQQAKPPQVLVSPAKKELGEAIATVKKVPKDLSEAKIKELNGRNLLMLKVRLRSIESALRDIKKRRHTLEAQLKSKYIDKKKYQEEMSALVAEGRKLLVDKERVEKEMKSIKQDK